MSRIHQLSVSGEPIKIGSRRELFVDRQLVDRVAGELSFPLHHPVPRGLVEEIVDRHRCPYRYMTVLRDGDQYRMYYALVDSRRVHGKSVKGDERICLAVSGDGIRWECPSLNLFSYKGNTENNIVWMEDGVERFGVNGFTPFLDTNPNCPSAERYKAVAEAGPKTKTAFGRNGLCALVSSDGIRWRMLQRSYVMVGGPGNGNFDSQNVAFWDAERGEYRLYRREYYFEGPERDFRDILTATSLDFVHWSEPERLNYHGREPVQLYTNNVTPYFRAPHIFLGFPVRYKRYAWDESIMALPELARRKSLIAQNGEDPDAVDPTGEGGTRIGSALTDALFMSSRDGRNFTRRDEAFIRPGLRTRNNWFYPDNFPAWGMLLTPSSVEDSPEELSFYVSEAGRREGLPNFCRRYSLRVDGFVSARGGWDGGEVLTRPLIFAGDQLSINFSTSAAGWVRIELQDEAGRPISGFSESESIPQLGDELDRRVVWRGRPDLSAIAGRVIKLRILLKDADLFAFQFLAS